MSFPVLNPRISYSGLKLELSDDDKLDRFLEDQKSHLYQYYNDNYIAKSSTTVTAVASTPVAMQASASTLFLGQGSPQKGNFKARYRKSAPKNVNELDQYFALLQEDIEFCDPVAWWYARRQMHPHLYRLTRDIMSMPGMSYIYLTGDVALMYPDRLSSCCRTHIFK